MTVKQQLISEIEGIDNPIALAQLFEIIQQVKQNLSKASNNSLLLQFAGCLDDADADDMRHIIASEFNKIEGEW